MSGPPNLTGKLLLAHPNLHDPNFRRSVIYLVKHDLLTGALGFIINRPTDQKVADLSEVAFPFGFEEAKVHFGGPVGTDSLIFARFDWDPLSATWNILRTIDQEDAGEMSDPEHTIALLGYAGWSPNQLENEIAENAWLIRDPDDSLSGLFEADTGTWKQMVGRMHPQLRLLAEMPDDPQLN